MKIGDKVKPLEEYSSLYNLNGDIVDFNEEHDIFMVKFKEYEEPLYFLENELEVIDETTTK